MFYEFMKGSKAERAWKCEEGNSGARRRCKSTTCAHERAALVQIASDGNDSGEGFFGDGIKGR